jgi:hypothetical protein
VVEQNIPNELWVARAYNHTKGVNIRLRYDLVVKAESTQFTRTLHYEMPNFMLHVANFLYFNKYMTEKSWHSLESLKSFLETNK